MSFFAGRGKKRAWNTWSMYPQATEAFLMMIDRPATLTQSLMAIVERFVVLLYDRLSESSSINEAQRLFTKGKRSLENIPPTAAALEQHTLYEGHLPEWLYLVPVFNQRTCSPKSSTLGMAARGW